MAHREPSGLTSYAEHGSAIQSGSMAAALQSACGALRAEKTLRLSGHRPLRPYLAALAPRRRDVGESDGTEREPAAHHSPPLPRPECARGRGNRGDGARRCLAQSPSPTGQARGGRATGRILISEFQVLPTRCLSCEHHASVAARFRQAGEDKERPG